MSYPLTRNATAPRRLTDVLPQLTTPNVRLTGYAAALATVLIWSCYFLSLRFGALSPLGTFELTLFRFAVPGLILLPCFIHRRRQILAVHPLWLSGILVGAGLPFFLLSAHAMGLAPVVQGSTLIPGTAPLFVTALAVMIFRQPLTRSRLAGLASVVAGILCMLAATGMDIGGAVFQGQLMFLLCSLCWALFTLSVRQSGLAPLETAAVLTVPSGVLLILYGLASGNGIDLGTVPAREWLLQLVVQGVAVGLGAGFLYGYAIRALGAEVTSAIGSLTPVCATLLAMVFLHESVELITLLGLSLVTLGVIAASGLIRSCKQPDRTAHDIPNKPE
ncbi:DMT family transporter [Saccharospirillum impatiens]|uniref:DMT family transporter n=1 Tax=Saccharospirillum impatiens TaxID=169438 RepID=UPI000684F334|nr:DMT family transporter [Saccharospirillum impatiens]